MLFRSDIKKQLGLATNFVLTRGRGTEAIPDEENIYETCTDGTKLYATTDVQWGGFMDTLFEAFEQFVLTRTPPRAAPVKVETQPKPCMSSSIQRRGSAMVQRAQTPYWKERGWRQNNGGYQGHFQTPFGSWPGYATVSPGGRVEMFISNPPEALHKHPHWPCFRARSDGWFFIHPVTRVPDVSAGLLGVEKTIQEAYEKSI